MVGMKGKMTGLEETMTSGSLNNTRMQMSNGYKTSQDPGRLNQTEDDAFIKRGARIAEKI